MLPPPAAAPPDLPSAPLSLVTPTVAVSGLLVSPAPIVVAVSSSEADSSVSSPLDLALVSALSSISLTPAQYFPYARRLSFASEGCPFFLLSCRR